MTLSGTPSAPSQSANADSSPRGRAYFEPLPLREVARKACRRGYVEKAYRRECHIYREKRGGKVWGVNGKNVY